ncbi:MAG: PGPGW domain-containing protein, partial [Ignavibacteria bacterium]|nr:PGPGW domain-containing protein [Ignavibacteria bacterium]
LKNSMINSLKQLKRILIAIIGGTIVVIGLFMIVLPGPAFIVIPLGLTILATEFIWAKRMIERFKDQFDKLRNKKK